MQAGKRGCVSWVSSLQHLSKGRCTKEAPEESTVKRGAVVLTNAAGLGGEQRCSWGAALHRRRLAE